MTRLLTCEEAARVLNVPKTRVYAACRRGEIGSVKLGRYRRVLAHELERWVAEQVNGSRRA